jgi:uncharacterized membrane protein YeaQ/YmgE (transglycosylase-associated protein family)
MGLIANVAVGIIGSWLGGMLAGAAGLAVVGSPGGVVASLIGAIVLIWLLRVLGVFKR